MIALPLCGKPPIPRLTGPQQDTLTKTLLEKCTMKMALMQGLNGFPLRKQWKLPLILTHV